MAAILHGRLNDDLLELNRTAGGGTARSLPCRWNSVRGHGNFSLIGSRSSKTTTVVCYVSMAFWFFFTGLIDGRSILTCSPILVPSCCGCCPPTSARDSTFARTPYRPPEGASNKAAFHSGTLAWNWNVRKSNVILTRCFTSNTWFIIEVFNLPPVNFIKMLISLFQILPANCIFHRTNWCTALVPFARPRVWSTVV